MGQGKSGFGVKIACEMDPTGAPGVFTVIGGLVGDIPYPSLNHPKVESTEHGEKVSSTTMAEYTELGTFKFQVNFNYNDPTHDHLTGVYKMFMPENNVNRGWLVTGPHGTTNVNQWLFSGQIENVSRTSAMKGVQSADVTIQPSGPWYIDGIKFGA